MSTWSRYEGRRLGGARRRQGLRASLGAWALLAVSVAWTSHTLASDIAKEQRWAEQIEAGLFEGKMLWLDAAGQRFLSILTPATGEPRGGVLLMHGIGVHPDWPTVINPLRIGLAAQGWTTLSLQMPILGNERLARDYVSLLAEVPARIETGVATLESLGLEPIVAVAHSMGSAMTSHYLAHHAASGIEAFVGIGMGADRPYPELDNAVSLRALALPVLDLYGEHDLESVVTTAQARAAAAADNDRYAQVEVAGADHFFDGFEVELLDVVLTWLERNRGR